MSEVAPSLVNVAIGLGDLLIGVYAIGVVIALFAIDAPGLKRLGLALLWPLGPAAFVITISLLLLALPIAFPVGGSLVLAMLIAAVVIGLRGC